MSTRFSQRFGLRLPVALDWAQAQGRAVSAGIEIGSYHALVAAVSAGMGLALVPAAVLRGLDPRGLQVQPLPEPWAQQTTWLVTRRGHPSAALRALAEALPEGN